MLEIEMKFAVSDHKAMGARLKEMGAVLRENLEETDAYFNAPDRDFGSTDEALRIRRIGPKNCVTYKGPKIDAHTKTRKEIEVPLADGEPIAMAFAELLTKLGYRASGLVKKKRAIYQAERRGFPMEVCLDDVDGLGSFVELEIRAEENQLDRARTVLIECAEELGLTASERRSYLQMLPNGP
jgi:adenylate cyclase class 2